MSKRALLIGCNYPGTKSELKGCISDVNRVKDLLLRRFGFDENDMIIMIDTDKKSIQPTGANIRKGLAKIVADTKPGDVLFVHYSGHGVRVPPESGKEDDTGYDECIVPCDLNLISDDDFREVVNKVPEGVHFTLVSDSCHSGGLIELLKEQIGSNTQTSGKGLGKTATRGMDLTDHRRGGDARNDSYVNQEFHQPPGSQYNQHGYGTPAPDFHHGGGFPQDFQHLRPPFGGPPSGFHPPPFGHPGGFEQNGPPFSHHPPPHQSQYPSSPAYGSYQSPSQQQPHYSSPSGPYQYSPPQQQQQEDQSYYSTPQVSSQPYVPPGQHKSDAKKRVGKTTSRSLPIEVLTQMLSAKSGKKVDIGNIRTTLFGMFKGDASPMVKTFMGLMLSQAPAIIEKLKGGSSSSGKSGMMIGMVQNFMSEYMDSQGGEGASQLSEDPVISAVQTGEVSSEMGYAGAKHNTTRQDVGILVSGCQSDETSADAEVGGSAFGALSNAIVTVLSLHPDKITNRELVLACRQMLQDQGYAQHPCLYCDDANLDRPYVCP